MIQHCCIECSLLLSIEKFIRFDQYRLSSVKFDWKWKRYLNEFTKIDIHSWYQGTISLNYKVCTMQEALERALYSVPCTLSLDNNMYENISSKIWNSKFEMKIIWFLMISNNIRSSSTWVLSQWRLFTACEGHIYFCV